MYVTSYAKMLLISEEIVSSYISCFLTVVFVLITNTAQGETNVDAHE